ncbi:MAG: ribosome assembly factor SBDS [Candidatus Altiarchaeota archaeon]
MVSLDDAVIARIKKHGHNFEIYVDPDLALSYKSGENVELTEVLAAENIFKDAGTTDKASEETILESFGSTDLKVVADVIIKKGELHLTTEQRKKISVERHKQVVDLIARNAINPQTKTPHPPTRIEAAMEEAKVRVVIDKPAKAQIEDIVRAINPILPIRFEKIQVALKIPAKYAAKLYSTLHEFGDMKKEEWIRDEQICIIEIPGGMQDELYKKMNSLTHGEIEIKVVR